MLGLVGKTRTLLWNLVLCVVFLWISSNFVWEKRGPLFGDVSVVVAGIL